MAAVTYNQQLHAKENLTLRDSQTFDKMVHKEEIAARLIIHPLSKSVTKSGAKTPNIAASTIDLDHQEDGNLDQCDNPEDSEVN